jgi:hypothetical protein
MCRKYATVNNDEVVVVDDDDGGGDDGGCGDGDDGDNDGALKFSRQISKQLGQFTFFLPHINK